MATADFDLNISIDCKHEDMFALVEVFKHYVDGNKGVHFNFVKLNNGNDTVNIEDLSLDKLKEFIEECEKTLSIEALGPYGHYMELDDINVFREMSEAAPDGHFSAEINGCTSYTEQSLHCTLEDKILHVKTYFASNDDIQECYVNYVLSKLSYQQFINLFKIDEEEFSEEDYETYIDEYVCYEDESLSQRDIYDIIDDLDVECSIDEEDYETIKEELESSDILGYYEYQEDYETGEEKEYDYNPILKEKIKE